MDGVDNSLVTRRPRRSTAGNRMEAALAEFKAEELGKDIDEDKDFIVELDEQDAFGSDFESTDEEGAQEDVDAAAEKMATEEERQKKKTARSHLDRITAAAHARQKATFNPEANATPMVKTPASKMNRRVSLGAVVDAETGAVLESGKRKSLRRHTMLNSSMTEIRAKDEKEKRSSMPRKAKVKTQAPTQDELIARALDMEDGNIKEHRDYLQIEEEKRKRARVVRTAVEGRLIRWVSKTEEVTVLVQPPAPAPIPSYAYPYSPAPPGYVSYGQGPPAPYSSSTTQPSTSPMTFVNLPYTAQATAPPLPPLERIEFTSKNYVVHESSQTEGAAKPQWNDTMTAMFGDHVRWDALKVYTGKGRPLSRPKDVCPITGQIARYRDPRTGVPFADLRAFEILTQILSHEFVWSESLGCYVSKRSDEGTPKPVGNPSQGHEML
ncbi:YL1 nuclear protein-domain-containing protein [Cytidiella melzeri]|nr:YL1 nuclear protein-domain-containing protein [Cytidiella melzeri]